MRKSKQSPWFQDVRRRFRFEAGASESYSLRGRCTGRKIKDRVIYVVTVPVPEYETRKITITLHNSFTPVLEDVKVDGPTDSRHRYSNGSLCMWYPSDPDVLKWVADDGLLNLITHARVHLFKEAWWRETGEWLGAEAPHGPSKSPA